MRTPEERRDEYVMFDRMAGAILALAKELNWAGYLSCDETTDRLQEMTDGLVAYMTGKQNHDDDTD